MVKKLILFVCLFFISLNLVSASSFGYDTGNKFDLSQTFASLTDTPSNYTGGASLCIKINGAETALEFGSCTGAGIDWSEAINGTLMSQADYDINYSANDAAYRASGGITWADATNGTLLTQEDFDTNYSTLITQELYDANYSANDETYRSTLNTTYDAYNDTGFIKDWNYTGWLINWSQIGSGVTLSDLLGFNYWNDTDNGFNQTYADILYCTIDEPLWTGNFTAYNESWTQTINVSYQLKSNYTDWGVATETDPHWTGNQSSYASLSDLLGFNYWNDTDNGFNQTYANLLYADISVVDTDTNLTEDDVEAYIFDDDNAVNITLGNYCIVNQSTAGGGSICHNGTGWRIIG